MAKDILKSLLNKQNNPSFGECSKRHKKSRAERGLPAKEPPPPHKTNRN